jgi:T6SS immunity protein Tdi1, C-terminal
MRLTDYILDIEGVAWGDLLASWAWLLPGELTVWFVNRFGDLFLVLDDGSVHRLEIGCGSLEKLAESREAFAQQMDEAENATDWLMIPLVDELVAGGVTLGPGQCYSYVQLPVLGGDYAVANTRVVSLAHHYSAFGPIHEWIKDLPDGTPVSFEVTDDESRKHG